MPPKTYEEIQKANFQLNHYLATLFVVPDAAGDAKAQAQDAEARARAEENIAGSVQTLVGTIIDAMKDLDHRLRSVERSGALG